MNRRRFIEPRSRYRPACCRDRVPRACRRRARSKRISPRPGTWRTFEMTTRVEILDARRACTQGLGSGAVRSRRSTQKPLGDTVVGQREGHEGRRPTRVRRGHASTRSGRAARSAPVVEVTSRFQTQDRAIDWSKKATAGEDDRATLKKWTQADRAACRPTASCRRRRRRRSQGHDDRSREGAGGLRLDPRQHVPRAQGARLRVGDIKTMLETQNFGGKCADLNGLFVGLVRAAGVPARDVYGIRVAPIGVGFKTLGAGAATSARRSTAGPRSS